MTTTTTVTTTGITATLGTAQIEQGRATAWNKLGNRTWTAEWLTDVKAGTAGHRMVTLRASHGEGVYKVTASIATREPSSNGFSVTTYNLFHDPMITVARDVGRFSQKRLKELFDAALADFDAAAFYAVHEVTFT